MKALVSFMLQKSGIRLRLHYTGTHIFANLLLLSLQLPSHPYKVFLRALSQCITCTRISILVSASKKSNLRQITLWFGVWVTRQSMVIFTEMGNSRGQTGLRGTNEEFSLYLLSLRWPLNINRRYQVRGWISESGVQRRVLGCRLDQIKVHNLEKTVRGCFCKELILIHDLKYKQELVRLWVWERAFLAEERVSVKSLSHFLLMSEVGQFLSHWFQMNGLTFIRMGKLSLKLMNLGIFITKWLFHLLLLLFFRQTPSSQVEKIH